MPPHKRPVNTVFQTYALFPFLDVWDNVEFGLRYRKVSKAGDHPRGSARSLELVQMTDYAQRRPGQLSGGQQQRVALARALVLNPTVLLLDEPLGALDAKLRKHLQLELKSLQQSVGITFVYVTHDQEEALTMSDRLAVMGDGLVEQIGAPGGGLLRAGQRRTSPGSSGSANVVDVEVLGPDGRRRWPAGSAAFALRRSGTPRPDRARSSSGPERISLGHGRRRSTRPRRGTTRSPAWSTTSSTSGRPRTSCVRLSDGQTLLVAVPNAGEPLSSPFVVGCPVRRDVRAGGGAGCSPARPTARRLDPPDAMPDQRGVSCCAPADADSAARLPATRRARRPRSPSRSRTARSGSTTGSSSATWMDSPSSSAPEVIAKSSMSTSPISPAA